jgi:hypothetical protein
MKNSLALLIALSLAFTLSAFGAMQQKPPATQKAKPAEEKSAEAVR